MENRDTGSDDSSDLSSDTGGINHMASDPTNKAKTMKCMYTNADNMMNKRCELLANIEAFKPDIIAITETLPKNRSECIQAAELEISDCLSTCLSVVPVPVPSLLAVS